jgi:hypothetical protein
MMNTQLSGGVRVNYNVFSYTISYFLSEIYYLLFSLRTESRWNMLVDDENAYFEFYQSF